MMRDADLFTDLEAAARQRQYRMRRLQVFNWGTFNDLHDIPIAEEGFLFVGRSGSGKSTLLDAIASLLVPPQWLSFNTAAREGDGGRYDRNLASYVRGAWADKKDLESGEIATHYLRTGSTWSALALTFANGKGRRLTLVQLFWLRGSSNRNADVRKHFMIAEGDFDIAVELNDFDLDIRALKQRLHEPHHWDKFRPYGERFRRALSIDSELALRLLHKTQSAKNLGDLNSFLREFMLEQPKTFEVANRLVEEFAELDAAHQAVVTARRQRDTLLPARDAYQRISEVGEGLADLDSLLEAMDAYRDQRRVRLLKEEIASLQQRDQALAGEEQQQTALLESQRGELNLARQRHREQGGGRIEDLEVKLEEGARQRDTCLRKRGTIEEALRRLDWPLPDNPHICAEITARARGEVEARDQVGAEAQAERDRLRDEMRQGEREFGEVRQEVEAMLSQPSNIPAQMLELRRGMVETLGLEESALPFVGELIQVKEAEAPWRGAIERVLHGFALSILVNERHYASVARYVNATRLGRRLVYYRVSMDSRSSAISPRPESLIGKLEIKSSPFADWLRGELARRFDYACVESLRAFRDQERAITREGQVRHNRSRHEKDDRYRIDDRRQWVLGFDNRDKLRLFQERAAELAGSIEQRRQRIEEYEVQRRWREQRLLHCQTLVNLEWREIDVASVLDRITRFERQLREIREGSVELQRLGEQIEALERQVDAAQTALNDIRVKRGTLSEQLGEHGKDLDDLEIQCRQAVLVETLEQRLDGRFAALDGALTLKNLDARRNRVEKALNDERRALQDEHSNLQRLIERQFSAFRREWKMEAADFDDTLASAPEFLKLLSRLEQDGLPQHEQRFFDLLREQSTENLAALNTHLGQARKQIYERMEVVNAGLAEAEFNPGTHLQIEVADRHLPDVREFREKVRQVLEFSWRMSTADAEQRFGVLRDLVHQLADGESEQQRWRRLVLDVRQHVEFVGRELDGDKNEVEVYRSGAGKSGGQREKLATTCLAAALRYQLGGTEDELPVYAPVVLDEAFGKADNEFTELAMKVFRKFGFQMVVATPLKSVMTLEPFIGGACFVDIVDRRRSATLQIEYDSERQRLRLPEESSEKVAGLPAGLA